MWMGGRNKEVRIRCEPDVSTLSACTSLMPSSGTSACHSVTHVLRFCRTHPVVRTANTDTSGTTRSGGAPSQLTSTYVTHMLSTGSLQQHIQTCLQPAYASRYANLMAAIDTHLRPLGFTLPQPARDVVGGYFVWLGLPSGLTADELSEACMQQAEVIIAPGEMFEVPGDNELVNFPTSIRLCFAWETEANLKDGVERIAKVAKKLLSEERCRTREYVIVEKEQSNSMDACR